MSFPVTATCCSPPFFTSGRPTVLTCQAECTSYICHPPTCPPSPGISFYILHAKPHGNFTLKVQVFVEGPKTKNPSLVPGSSLYFFLLLSEEEGEKKPCFQFTVTREHFLASAPSPGRHQRPTLTAAALSGGYKTKPPQAPSFSPARQKRR